MSRTIAIFGLVFLGAVSAHAEAPLRHHVDARDLTGVRNTHPHAALLLDEGEALLSAGDAKRAAELFAQASQEARGSSLLARRECEALIQLERRDEAIAACRRAVNNEGSPLDFRAIVGAFMLGPLLPSTEELAQSIMYARRAREILPNEPWGYAAQCDIARRLGDTVMFNQSLDQLQRVAPEHPETARAAAWAATMHRTWPAGVAWALITIASFGTAAHALRRARRNSLPRLGAIVSAFFALSAVWGSPGRAWADDEVRPPQVAGLPTGEGLSTTWPVNKADPESSVPTVEERNKNPLEFGYHLMDLGDGAEEATKRGDHRAAVKFYRAMAKAVPDRSIAFAKACEAYEADGDTQAALPFCRVALGLPGVRVVDYARFVHLLVGKQARLDDTDREDIEEVIKHLSAESSNAAVVAQLQCEYGVRIGDRPRLEQCTKTLAGMARDDPKTISFQWALAVLKNDDAEAKRLLARAKTTPLKAETLRHMEETTAAAGPWWRRLLRDWRTAALAIIALGLSASLYATRRRSVMAVPEKVAG